MVGPRGWITLIGLMVFLTAGGECRYDDECCVKDWMMIIGDHIKDFMDMDSPEFKKFFLDWQNKSMKMMADDQPEGICQGMLSLKCEGKEGEEKEGLCKCNNVGPFKYSLNRDGDTCVAKSEGMMCINGPSPNKCGKGMKCEGIKMPDGMKGVGTCKKVQVPKKNGSVPFHIHSPIIMWVLITVLAYIGRSVIGMEGRLSAAVPV